MKKILHVNDSWIGGGAEAVFRDTIKISEELGYQCKIFISDEKRNLFSFIYSIKYYNKIKKVILSFRPDIIHIHNYYHFLSPSILMAIKKLKQNHKWTGSVIYTAHDYHLICPNSGLQYFKNNEAFNFSIDKKSCSFFKKYDRRGYVYSNLKLIQHLLCYKLLKLDKVIDKIISPSLFLQEVFKNWNVSSDIIMIRNPIAELNEQVISNKCSIKDEVIRIVFVGRVTQEKGIIELINKIQKSKLKIELHIYGFGELLKTVNTLKLRNHFEIISHGYVEREQLLNEITDYDVFVLPSIWYENAPLSILEAANLGLPVIVPNYGGLKEIAKLTNACFLFDHHAEEIDETILSASRQKGLNYILEPVVFSYDYYKKEINHLYSED